MSRPNGDEHEDGNEHGDGDDERGDGGERDDDGATSTSDPNVEEPVFEAARYADGTVTYPPHPVGPNGAERVGTVDLREQEARVITWTRSTATPPGVRAPNALAIVEFDLGPDDGPPVRAIGQIVEEADVEIGDLVIPVYHEELREPGAGIREPDSQDWDGFRFEPIE
ncbi:hypothetical protein ACERIT_02235 [Halopenitus sp. H-Gu1]|uniref:hypothetical protein n=1 Tax=Halopenitus sp. H-Gu1 TaxID=3242697 RepID=UPI00359D4D57